MNKKFAFLLLILCLFACSPSANKDYDIDAKDLTPTNGDSFIVANLSDASFLNPILASDTSSSLVNNKIFNGLIKYDKDLNIVGDLAESFTVSKDGLEIIFH